MNQSFVFISTRLGGGGAEKHLLRLVNELSKQGMEVNLLLTQKGGEYEEFLNKKIKIIFLNNGYKSYLISLIKSVKPLIVFLRRNKIKNLIAIQDGPILVAIVSKILMLNRVKIFGWVQNNPVHLRQSFKTLPYYLGLLFLFGRLEKLICLSKGVEFEYLKIARSLSSRSYVIPNIGHPEIAGVVEQPQVIKLDSQKFNLVACGRFVPQKNYSMMLEGFSKAYQQNNLLHLTIIGDGVLKPMILKRIEELQLTEQVTLVGFISDPENVIKQASIFLLSSDFEGFGNVIVEAMASGVPVISTDCPHGPSEIINHGINGLLIPVNSSDLMCQSILKLALDHEMRKRFIVAGIERSKEFTASNVVSKFLKIYGDE